jgi:hypothetical protein
MKKFYSFIIIAFFLFPLAADSIAQEEPDSVKIASLLRVKSSKPDNNWAGKGTALCDFENDLLAQVSIADFTMSSDMIDSVMLRIFFKTPNATGDFAFHDMDPNWVDTTITWNTATGLTVADNPFATLAVDQDADAHYWLNITEYTKAAIDKGVDFGWRIKSVEGIASATARTSYHADAIMQPTIFLYKKDATAIRTNQKDELSVYPNPATDYAMVNLKETTQGYINVYNTVGERVLRKQVQSEHMRLDLATLNSGVYFLTVESGQNISKTTKIIVR